MIGTESTLAFIHANTEILTPPLVPEIRLHLATEITPIWMATEREFYSVVSRSVQNGHNTARWPSSSWHDTWLKA